MKFEWDAKKSSANKIKHGIDFETAKNIWLDENRVEIHAPHPMEDRRIMIGKHHNKIWTAICTMRGNAIRIISVRHARKKEAELYDKEKAG
ncbi:MAG: BrnT family toxin [Deltaproteobacteria bacterium]|nr:MAG: BrnT family toxin [Deltaproteobacteria bacterium]